MNKSCVRRLPGSEHGGGRVCWAPRLVGRASDRPPAVGVLLPLLMGPRRTGAVSELSLELAQAGQSSVIPLRWYPGFLLMIWAGSQGWSVSLPFCSHRQQNNPEDVSGRGTPAWCSRERRMCQVRQTHPESKARGAHVETESNSCRQGLYTCGHTQRWICYNSRTCMHIYTLSNMHSIETSTPLTQVVH